ncbi:ATP-binding sensor histidine kinase [Dapis sp. BLCC M229]|uniref:ATP-binding sensor histidine kinase n=1 Tax=Dapis sp. BLCC M229 TaxID=3400188 RepID=UPI003CECB719
MSIIVTSLTNYEIGDLIHESERTVVYRGVAKVDTQPVVIKLMRNDFPSFQELVQFRNQYTIAKNLSVEGILKPLALLNYQNRYALIMPDFGGISLGQYYQKLSPGAKDISRFLDIAIQIAEIVYKLHQNRIIHKDIKPANILINPETKQVKIIDFSISSLLPKETQTIQNYSVLEGTLAYISPEQTGRMNRGIDYRSDFYSLGVTFFEILNGTLPFETTDPMELVHCHLAKMPVLGNTEEIPKVLSQIVMKLMAKNAENRYRSALGLKYDLEKCRQEWQFKGEIEYFELGSRDISDRFLIPEKLYGREIEIQTLLDAFERVAIPPQSPLGKGGGSEMMLVAGFSGIGKTVVVNEVHKPIVRQRGYFIKGKFDQFNRSVPFSALVQSLRDLMGQLLSERDAQLQQWKDKILDAVGENGQVIVDVIPELEKIIGKQPSVPELSGSAAQNRFNLLFGKFIQVFTTKEHPLVIFLDDLQWADSASLNLMKLLMSEASNSYLLMIGAYRDNEVFPAHPLMLTLDEMGKAQATINTITLAPLSVDNINHLVADTLSCDGEVAKPLTELVYQKTKGNPFFTTQFLLGLYGDELIKFNREVGYWECDIAQVRQRALTDDVVEFMAQRLQKLPTETQEVLKLAACIGNQFDLGTLAVVCEQSKEDTADSLWRALQESFILPQSQVYKFYLGLNKQDNREGNSQVVNYKFLHDQVQQAAYSLIANEHKQKTHLKIGRILLKNIPQQEQENKIFDIVNQLNFGLDLIKKPAQKDELAKLNFIASRKAKDATAYVSAAKYADNCQRLLPENSWNHQYELTLSLHQLQAEIAYLTGNFIGMEKLAKQVLQKSKTTLDKVKIYEIKIEALTAQKDMLGAINSGLEILKMLGVEFPNEPSPADIDAAFKETAIAMANRKPSELLELPQMQKAEYVNGMQIMMNLIPCTHMAKPLLFPLTILKLIYLSLSYGNAPASSFAYTVYAILLWDAVGDIVSAYEFACLGLELSSRSPQNNLKPRTVFVAYCFSMHWKQHLSQSLQPLELSYSNSLEVGDLAFAGYCANTRTRQALYIGKPLDELALMTANYSEVLQKINQINTFSYNEIFRQTILNLVGDVENPVLLIGQACDEKSQLPILENANDGQGLAFLFINKLFLAYTFGNFHQAIENAENVKKYLYAIAAMYIVSIFYFYDSLSRLQKFTSVSENEQIDIFQYVNSNQDKIKNWAHHAPMNFQHKYDLVEAEKHRVLGQNAQALELYDRAISGAKINEYLPEEALGNELAAKFYLDWGKEKVAAGYMQEAYYCYARWGAKAKTDDLEKRYPDLLTPILKQAAQSLNFLETLSTFTQSSISIHNSITATHPSTSSINSALDFATVLKAQQTLSATIELDELLRQLTQIILQHSGCDRCALILPDETGEWQVQAITTPKEIQLCTEPLNNDRHLPVKLIQYVKNTYETVVIDDLETDLPVVDDYLKKHQPKSVLALPMLNQGRCIGTIFLENHLTSGVFTRDRILLLNFLCTQAAISIQNSLLYKELEHSLLKAQKTSQELIETVAISKGQQQILALIAQGLPLTQMLEETSLYIESQSRHAAYCSFLLLEGGERLRNLASPSLPADYCALIDGVAIGPEVGSCGRAAYYKASVTVTDIATDPLWANLQVALYFGLCACASTPILGADGQVLATLAMYLPEPGEFTLHDRQLIEVATYLARIAIERHQADIELQQLNLQMIQGEKMATLGNLVAGVAHEVNNPIGFLNGSIENTKDYVQYLFEHLDTYQSQQPPNEVVQDSAEEIELEFILEDLPKLLDSMQNATDRIKGISTSLRTFSRADTEHKVSASLHEGLNSTLLILKYRLKASEKRPGIEVVKNYGDVPDINCFPGQLNQVFMNILANAIDMFDEVAQQMTLEDLKSNPQKITIQTANLTEQNVVEIQISDNGKGIPDEVKSKIFEHLFTTKGVGKGTGLGLAIAKQIIEEKHGGKIDCISQFGKGTKFIITLPLNSG